MGDVRIHIELDNIKKAEEFPIKQSTSTSWLSRFQSAFFGLFSGKYVKTLGLTLLMLIYSVYLAAAIYCDVHGSVFLIIITGTVILYQIYLYIARTYSSNLDALIVVPLKCLYQNYYYIIKWCVYPCMVIGFILYISVVVVEEVRQLQSLLGLVLCLVIPYVTCKHPDQIRWRPVLWGLGLQVILGIITLRWQPGYNAMHWLSGQINTFLNYALYGASLAFGDPFFLLHPIMMMTLPIVIYIGCVTGFLYWNGWIQSAIKKLGFLMRHTLDTTGVESANIILNLFLSVAEIATMLKPYLPNLTRSEFHTLLVGSHASIAGFAYALFVLMGVDGRHLLIASLMSAPAAVAISKLNYPETETSLYKTEKECEIEVSEVQNPFEAMSIAATQAGRTCASLLTQLIGFMSVYAFVDACVAYLGSRIGWQINLQVILSLLCKPLAWLVGIEWGEVSKVSEVIGLKLTISEVVAYLQLGSMRRSRQITERASMLTTYAICGFSSFGTLATFLGVWASVVPERRAEIAAILPRVYLNTNIACFLTACVAGVLYSEDIASDVQGEPKLGLQMVLDALPDYRDILSAVGYL